MSFFSTIGRLFGASQTPPPARPEQATPTTQSAFLPYTPPAAPAPSIQPSPGHSLLTSLRGGGASLAETLSSYDRLSPALKANLETRVYNYHHDLNCQDPRFNCQYGEIALRNDIRCLYDVKGSLHPILSAAEPSKQQALVTLISLLDSLSTTPSELTAAFNRLDASIKGPIQGLIYHSHSQKYGPAPENYQLEHGKNAVRANPWILLNKPAGSSKTLLELSLDAMGASAPTSSAAARTIVSPQAPAASASSLLSAGASSFVPGQPVGINNGGNNCWANSDLQLVLNNPELEAKFSNHPAFTHIFTEYRRTQAARSTICGNLTGKEARAHLVSLGAPVGGGCSQEDAAIAFETMLGSHNGLPFYSFRQSVNGRAPIEHREPMIALPMESGATFQQLFDAFFFYVAAEGDSVRKQFNTAPQTLVVQLRRFTHQRTATGDFVSVKNNTERDIPLTLTVSRDKSIDRREATYECNGFNVHLGTSLAGGHYVAYVKKPDGWWYCSDSNVRKAPLHEVEAEKRQAYVCTYRRV